MFLFSSADFLQNKVFLKINHPGPPSECQTVWLQIKTDILLVFIWVQNVCKRLLANDKIIHWHAKSYNFSVQYIVSPKEYTCICIPYIFGHFKYIQHAMPFKQNKSNFQRIQLESVLLSNAKWDTFIPSKIFISFVELSVLYYLRYM